MMIFITNVIIISYMYSFPKHHESQNAKNYIKRLIIKFHLISS